MQFHDRSEISPEFSCFVAYVGPSMNPTLCEPELMEIEKVNNKPLRVGDVVLFLPDKVNQPVVHRIVRLTPFGISTRGDNNTFEDLAILQPHHVIGKVVAAWQGQKRRRIIGGNSGRLLSLCYGWRRSLGRRLTPILHPLYQALSHWGVFARLLPTKLRPRILVFHIKGRDQFLLMLGDHNIGRYDEQRNQWQIKRPYHLFVDDRMLSKPRAEESLIKIKPDFLAKGVRYELVLADGVCWQIASEDEEAAVIISQLRDAMQLHEVNGNIDSSPLREKRQLMVRVDAHCTELNSYVPLAIGHHDQVKCILSPSAQWEGLHVNLMRLSLVFAREAQAHGGLLMHGALAERDGIAVIMAAPGGTGKTTASNRLKRPWLSLCDDTTLVVKDQKGKYWAHPWPTWSRFQNGGPGGAWDVQKAVPLKGIFILTQAPKDRMERVGSGQAVGLMIESVTQASIFMTMGLPKAELSCLHLEQFNNLCALTHVIQVNVLHISLTGSFWQEIEQVLCESI